MGKGTHNGITVSLIYQYLYGRRINGRRQVQCNGNGLIGIRYTNGDRQPRMRIGSDIVLVDIKESVQRRKRPKRGWS